MFGKKKRKISDGAGELRALVSPTQTRTGSLDLGPPVPAPEQTELTALAPSARDLQDALDTSEAELADLMERLTAMAGERVGTPVALLPYLMLPAECWDSPHQRVLIETLDLTPTQPWNVVPLGATGADAVALDLAQHPLVVSPAVIAQSRGLVDDIIEVMLSSFERATFGGDTVDADALASARDTARSEIVALARRVAAAEIGSDGVAAARSYFFAD